MSKVTPFLLVHDISPPGGSAKADHKVELSQDGVVTLSWQVRCASSKGFTVTTVMADYPPDTRGLNGVCVVTTRDGEVFRHDSYAFREAELRHDATGAVVRPDAEGRLTMELHTFSTPVVASIPVSIAFS